MLGTPTIFFDVDDTLLLWSLNGVDIYNTEHPKKIKATCFGRDYWLVPHTEHIEKLKAHKAEGFKIVVWTAAGEEWGREVVRLLNLEAFVDVVLSKPSFYYDDVPTGKFMHHSKRLYTPYKESE